MTHLLPNPRRPPRGWFRRCVKGVEKSGEVSNPNAVCGSVWYHKLSAADRRRITRESEPLENPTFTGTQVLVGAAVVVGVAWLFFKPKTASAATKPTCASDTDVKSFVAAKGYGVVIFDGIPSTPPIAGFDAAAGRVYSKVDCGFYRWLALDGAKSVWMKDAALDTQFTAWRNA